jgi:hypothetical protein
MALEKKGQVIRCDDNSTTATTGKKVWGDGSATEKIQGPWAAANRKSTGLKGIKLNTPAHKAMQLFRYRIGRIRMYLSYSYVP